jgi:hypothetical protein
VGQVLGKQKYQQFQSLGTRSSWSTLGLKTIINTSSWLKVRAENMSRKNQSLLALPAKARILCSHSL